MGGDSKLLLSEKEKPGLETETLTTHLKAVIKHSFKQGQAAAGPELFASTLRHSAIQALCSSADAR